MSDVNKKFDSKKDQLSGKAKEVEGKVTGDRAREAQGKTQSLMGKAKDKLADAEETVKGVVDEAKDKMKKESDD
ncbi:CsbD family protein [Lactiplantibacillus plantarum]|uniref:CsbD family protein n=1 Tax=Lactiplantibacillus plantarum TaxID=1590 RepID=UPI0022E5FE44|nr:CsbD family protein [Lactiplantibacillus plantarum]